MIYILIDHFDTPYVMPHRIGWRCPLTGVLGNSLMVGSRLTHTLSIVFIILVYFVARTLMIPVMYQGDDQRIESRHLTLISSSHAHSPDLYRGGFFSIIEVDRARIQCLIVLRALKRFSRPLWTLTESGTLVV